MTTDSQITRSQERGRTQLDWLDGRHSFSFGGYYDPVRMGFGPLRVVNDDIIAPGGGFPTHPHREMEIITIVLDGELEHKDSMGNGRIIRAGEIQYMSAGTGVTHSEFNPSSEKPVHLMQIWIQPNQSGQSPSYADQALVGAEVNAWSLLLSPDGREGSIAIRQDVELRSVQLMANKTITYEAAKQSRGFWIFVLEGTVQISDTDLAVGDSIALSGQKSVEIVNAGLEPAKVMLFDVPV